MAAVTAVQSSPPPKTIVNERTSAFCTALHTEIAPAVLKLIQNKSIVTDGKALFLKFADDQVRHSRAIDLHMVQLNNLIGPMAQNLIDTNSALNKLPAIPAAPRTGEERRLVELRSQLRQIADEQNKMLNIFSGTYGSFSSNELLDRENPLGNAVRDKLPPPKQGPQQDNPVPIALAVKDARGSAQGPSTPEPAPSPTQKYLDLGLAGGTAFAKMFNQLTLYQVQELKLESQASQSILQAAALCR
jgi:hypothetical protein